MTTTAQTRYAEALAHEVADALRAAPQAAGRVEVRFDNDADTWAVRITIARVRYDLTMPAPGARYGLFRRNRWLGGLTVDSSAAPVDVALALLDRIAQTTR